MNLMTCFNIFMTAMFAALVMVPYLQRWALDTGTVDTPDDRKVHTGAIPRVGGIAIGLAFLFSILVYVDISREMRGIAAGGLILFFTGLVDDLYGLTPKKKFLGECAGCLCTIAISHLYIHRLGDPFGFGPIELPAEVALPFTLFAVVGVVNAVNLIDGLDGLAGGVSVIALAAFSFLSYEQGSYPVLFLCVGLLGGLFGFLKYNFFPARVFMGDAGSLEVGFVLAFISIYLTEAPGAKISPVVPFVVLGIPIVDTLRVMAKRLLHRTSPFAPDMSHVHHRILDLGLKHRFTVIAIYALSVACAVSAVANRHAPDRFLLAGFVLGMGAFYLGMRHVRRHRERLPFLGRDSAVGVRHSVTYRRLSDLIAHGDAVILVLISGYLSLAVLAGSLVSDRFVQMALTLVVASVFYLFYTHDARNHFVLAMLYFVSLMVAAVLVRHGRIETLPGWSAKRISDSLLLGLVAIVSLRFLFRKPGEFFLASVDYLFLCVSVFLVIVAPQVDPSRQLTSILARGIVLFVGLKVAVAKGKRQAMILGCGMLAVLAIIAVEGYIF